MDRRLVSLGCLLVVSLALAARAEEPPPAITPPTRSESEQPAQTDPTQAQVSRWIEQLADSDFQRREDAVQRLVETGLSAVEQVAQSATSQDPEVSWRAGEILERIGTTGDEPTVEAVCRAMEQLAAKSERFGRQAVELKGRWREFRHERAVDHLSQLGARLQGGGFDEMLTLTPAYAPIFLSPTTDSVVYDFDSPGTEIYSEVVIDAEVISEEAGAELDVPAPPKVRPSLVEAGEAELVATLVREVTASMPEVVTTRKVEAIDAALKAFDADEMMRTIISEASAADTPPTLAGGVVDSAGTEVPADVVLLASSPIEIDASELVAFDFTFATTGVPLLSEVGGGDGRSLELGPNWTGTDDDLRWLKELNGVTQLKVSNTPLSDAAFEHIQRMSQLRQLTMHHVAFDPQRVITMKRERPEVQIHAFGAAVLGISGDSRVDGFQVTHVSQGSGAQKAGLRDGDMILTIDDKAITSFEALSWSIAPHEPGDVVTVQYRRGREVHSQQVTLSNR